MHVKSRNCAARGKAGERGKQKGAGNLFPLNNEGWGGGGHRAIFFAEHPPPFKKKIPKQCKDTQPFQKPLQPLPEITLQMLPTYLLPCLRASLLPVLPAAVSFCLWNAVLASLQLSSSGQLCWSITNDHFSSNKTPHTLSVMSTWFTIIVPKDRLHIVWWRAQIWRVTNHL